MRANRKMRRMLALLFAVLLFTCAACRQAEESSGTSVQAPMGAAGSETPAEAAAPEPKSTSKVAYLTGLPKGDDYPEGQRIGAVMVNNIAVCRPLSGLSDADVLVEVKVEGGITRFMALYQDYKAIPRVGPVRSSRDQFFQLLLPSYGFLVHIGESAMQQEYRQNWDYAEFDMDGDLTGDIVAWDKERRAAGFAQEHTAYTDGGLIAAHVESAGLDDRRVYNSSFFNFHAPEAPLTVPGTGTGEGIATEVEIVHSKSYKTYFTYDPDTHLYEMSMYNAETKEVEPTVDEASGKRLAFENVFVTFAPMEPYKGHEDKDLQKVTYDYGYGIYFTEGGYVPVMSVKEGPQDPLRFYDINNADKQIAVNPGKSYLAVVDSDQWSGFYRKVYERGRAAGEAAGASSAADASGAAGAAEGDSASDGAASDGTSGSGGTSASESGSGGGDDSGADGAADSSSGPLTAADISEAAKAASKS